MAIPASRVLQTATAVVGFFVLAAGAACAQEEQEPEPERGAGQPMTTERLGELIRNVDEDAVQDANRWFFKVAETDVVMIYDEAADRMRIMVPIAEAESLEPDELRRLLQANFDTALDARYAIAQGILWGTYIHPLSTLTDEEFLVGLGQTVNVADSYGTSYSSGVLMFNGGDAAEIRQQELIEELKKKRKT